MKLKMEYIILAVVIFALAGYLFVKKTNHLNYTLPATPVIAKSAITKLQYERTCSCKDALKNAFMTSPKAINKKTKKKLELLVKKYI